MQPHEFFADQELPGGIAHPVLRMELLQSIRNGPISGRSDVEVGLALTALARQEFEEYGTRGKPTLTDAGSRQVMRTLDVVLKRIGIADFVAPFVDFPTFRNYWVREGASGAGGWGKRRIMVDGLFEPLQRRLEALEDDSLAGELITPIVDEPTGWAKVDEEIRELRRHFHSAQTVQDLRNVGNDCVTILEELSAVAYDPVKNLRPGETEPPVAQTKNRLDRVVEDALPGASSSELRTYTKKLIELAQAVKHNPDGGRAQAAIVAGAVIQLAGTLRLLLG